MVEIEKPRIECVENPGDGSYGKYVVEPLERGYGTTLGNSLRRILLSSLPGTAVTSIKIAGVQHEFTTIPGVKEDVTEIVLNVKGIIAKLYCEGVKTVHIEAADDVREALLLIKKLGVKAGLSIKPDTDPLRIQPFLDILDLVLVMTVQPGFGGQSFLPHSPAQIAAVRAQISAAGWPVWLEVDGGINAQTAREAARAGADAFVAGNAIFAAQDPKQALADIRQAAAI